MKLSTRGRYGFHAMYELAAHYGEAPLSIKTLAERQGLSEAYLEQLIALLRRDELVVSVRGAQGGYRLSRAPEEITVGEILRCLEGGLDLVDCLTEEDRCQRAVDCPTRLLWKRIRDGLTDLVNAITLKDMLTDYERACARGEET